MERHEADLYRRYRDWFSYGFYVARRRRIGRPAV
ncbi:MAG: SAM-dependent methyltransferase, partial [Krumholzibacteria bacterium]|nr:SAM-dependent methyltransferase [Candidatus Krumholzibacteria bacterium]